MKTDEYVPKMAKSIAVLKREHGVDEVLAVSAKTEAGTKGLWGRLRAVAE